MKDGIYEVIFTTDQGNLGSAATVIRGNAFVGADAMHFYRGEFDQVSGDAEVIMEVTRHDFTGDSAFGTAPLFTLTWKGEVIGDSMFKLTCKPETANLTIHITGKLLKEVS
jgi:hypothetical protein